MRGRAGRLAAAAALLFLSWGAADSRAHGSLSMEEDLCKLWIGPYSMHFVGYQPDETAAEEFCEDIPATGRTIVVLDFIETELRDLPTEVRIIRDTGSETDLDSITVLHMPPQLYPRGTLNFKHTFEEAGNFVGLVTVRGESDMVARFPFAVGSPGGFGAGTIGLIIAVVLGAVGLYWVGVRSLDRAAGPSS